MSILSALKRSLFKISLIALTLASSHFNTTLAQNNAHRVDEIRSLVNKEPWAQDIVQKIRQHTREYADSGSRWLADRLQMHWNSHATKTFVKGNIYSHCGGDSAPAPTVKFNGVRSHVTNYVRPKLSELKPRSDEPQGMWLKNKTIPGEPYEWAAIGQTGNIIGSINNEIMSIARDAAFIWHLEGDDALAQMAAEALDTYLTGIYWKDGVYDLNNGHIGTLVGVQTFEVIHEDALAPTVECYDFLRPYLKKHFPGKEKIYDAALKKWADTIISHGVPHNNWNLMQARAILQVGLVLDTNEAYPDKKGKEYYSDYVLNKSSIRQWSLKDLANAGYDAQTGIWAECPGYSQVVINDYTDLADMLRRDYNIDLIAEIPVIANAAESLPQYLFPDRMIAAFGDTHPGALNPNIYKRLIKNARHFGKKEQEEKFTALYLLTGGKSDIPGETKPRVAVSSFYADSPLTLDVSIFPANIDSVVTPTFHAPNASWIAMRNGMQKENSLMAVINGSEGNHAHANGISLELYGKGLRMGPDGGIGLSLYSGDDYLEYYSQFPAHNTVCVDGISSYPVMKSNHPLEPQSIFPPAGEKMKYTPLSYSDVYFFEPETRSDQRRLVGIVNTSDSTGYYIDIFRSRRQDGKDKTHDYFYHNLGQEMKLTSSDGNHLDLQPTEELAFAGAHLYAYSYIFDKKSVHTPLPVRAEFIIKDTNSPTDQKNPDRKMTMWMNGSEKRNIFQALSPMTEGLSRLKNMPYNIKEQPTLTFVARKYGEAWNKPFMAIFEPSSETSPSLIANVEYPDAKSGVAAVVNLINGDHHIILSSDDNQVESKTDGLRMKGIYSVFTPNSVLLAEGTYLKAGDIEIRTEKPGDVLVEKTPTGYKITSTAKGSVKTPAKTYRFSAN